MKRWITVLTALGIFFATIAISVVSVLSVYASNAHAASIYAKNIAVINDFSTYSQFFKERGIQLLTTPSLQLANDSWTATNSGDKDTLYAAAILTAEFTKFTPQQLQKTGLKKIYLVKDLYVEGQYRSGMPEPHFEHALYFDVGNDYLTSENGVYMKRVFQHELLHLIEYDLYNSYAPVDTAWDACNASGFIYGKGGASMYANPDFAHKIHPSYGFINGYATSGQEEDKAEMFAEFMTNPIGLASLADKDSGIACKVSQTTALLQSL